MTMTMFKAHGNKYKFEYQLDYWGEAVLILFENEQIIGVLNVNYSIEEGEKIVRCNESFKETEAIIA